MTRNPTSEIIVKHSSLHGVHVNHVQAGGSGPYPLPLCSTVSAVRPGAPRQLVSHAPRVSLLSDEALLTHGPNSPLESGQRFIDVGFAMDAGEDAAGARHQIDTAHL
jgi:hypothetical protein